MKICDIDLLNFRNYANEKICFSEGINIIYGDNSEGKTNLLESIYFISNVKSFRTYKKKELINFDSDSCSISGNFNTENLNINLKYTIYDDKRLEIFKNNIKIKKHTDVFGMLKTVLFCPDNLNLIKDSSVVRRRMMDNAISQLKPNYSAAISEYSKILEIKNRILKLRYEKPSMLLLLDDYNEKLAQLGSLIIRYRNYFIKLLDEKTRHIHREICNGREDIEIIYVPNPDLDLNSYKFDDILDILRNKLIKVKSYEVSSGCCLVGPHKDDIDILISSKSAKSYASQGQCRTAVVALKLAEREIFRDNTGEYPILLLDDVLSELDPFRQDYVANKIKNGQVFITSPQKTNISNIGAVNYIHIKNGAVKI